MRIVFAIFIGIAVGAVMVMMWACLAIDKEEAEYEDHYTGRTEGEAETEVRSRDDVHAE